MMQSPQNAVPAGQTANGWGGGAAPILSDLAARVSWRAAQFANSPSLLAVALLLDGAFALIPTGSRIHKENLT
jgi:hypothetical protein